MEMIVVTSTPKEDVKPKVTTTKTPNWFAQWAATGTTGLPQASTPNPFSYKIDQSKETNFPVIEVNGPSIKLPSFPIVSDALKLFSKDVAESRTASGNNADVNENNGEEFDLKFFPQRAGDEKSEEKFTLLSNEPNLSDLETTTTESLPMVTQSLSPSENREALSQLVSLYERAPTLQGEADKTEQKVMEEDKEVHSLQNETQEGNNNDNDDGFQRNSLADDYASE